MKKFLTVLLTVVICFACLVVVGCNNNQEIPEDLSVAEIVSKQAHEEKAGYKFCGYFEDSDFTKRVVKTFDAIPKGYYAKYQIDKTKLMEFYHDLQFEDFVFEQTLYTKDFRDAVTLYEYMAYATDYISASSVNNMDIKSKKLGMEFTAIDYIKGPTEKNKLYDLHDQSTVEYQYYSGASITKFSLTRNNRWKAYVGEVLVSEDGFEYFIVDDYAVVVGFNKEEYQETIDIPSTIQGKTVKVVSMVYSAPIPFTCNTIKVPSSVESAVMCFNVGDCSQNFKKITFAEGVKTVQLVSSLTEELVIPSTVYYLDIHVPHFYYHAPLHILNLKNQTLTIDKENVHYYTKDGMIYSTEGDLIYQFSNRDKLNIKIDENAKRVLRGSINGLAKNIHIPKNLEYFDVFFNEFSNRHVSSVKNGTRYDKATIPVFIIDSKEVAKQLLEFRLNNSRELGTYFSDKEKLFVSSVCDMYDYLVLCDGLEFDEILNEIQIVLPPEITGEISDSQIKDAIKQLYNYENILKIEGDFIYAHLYDTISGVLSDEWSLISCKTENVTDELLQNDSVLRMYFEYIEKK